MNSERRKVTLYILTLVTGVVVAGVLLWSQGNTQQAATPTIIPTPIIEYRSLENLSYTYYLLSGEALETMIGGHVISLQLLRAERTSISNPRLISTTFAILNNGPEPLMFDPNKVFAAANSSGMRRSRGSEVFLVDAKPVELPSRVETEFTFNWDMNIDSGNVWIVANTPITEQNTVAVQPDLKVIMITFNDPRK